jgi:hypothetical protein
MEEDKPQKHEILFAENVPDWALNTMVTSTLTTFGTAQDEPVIISYE